MNERNHPATKTMSSDSLLQLGFKNSIAHPYLPMEPHAAAPVITNKRQVSKRALNINAAKFKLTYLDPGALIRYEVIYKNLLRDMRKFFGQLFAETMPQMKQGNTHEFQKSV